MRVTHRVASLLAVGMIGLGSTAGAQVTYSTTGFFTGTNSSVCTSTSSATAATIATCTGGAIVPFTLVFRGLTATNVTGPIDFGTLDLTATGPGSLTLSPGQLFFNLIVTQTTPGPTGSVTPVGGLTGSITSGGVNSSTLIWTPTPTTFSINGAQYAFNFDASGPASGIGYVIPLDQTGIPSTALKGSVTTTPEPGSIALFATGLAGLIPVAIRRRKNAK
jgi:hypothetical protein